MHNLAIFVLFCAYFALKFAQGGGAVLHKVVVQGCTG
jgi:hypothetical protein